MLLLLTCATLSFGQTLSFESAVTFGDSVTRNDALGVGPDPHELVFARASVGGDVLTNYAVSGAVSEGVRDQMLTYRADVQQGAELATFIGSQIGGNDLIDGIAVLSLFPPGDPLADAVVDEVVSNITRATLALLEAHPGAVITLWNLPDLSQVPATASLTPTQAANLRAHVEVFNDALWPADAHPSIVIIDTFTLIDDVLANPPILHGVELGLPPSYGAPSDLFVDLLHPTAVGNGLLANEVMTRLNDEFGESFVLYDEDELAAMAQIP